MDPEWLVMEPGSDTIDKLANFANLSPMRCKFGAFDAALEGIEALEERMEWWQDVCVHWWSWFINSKVDINPSIYCRSFFLHWESSSKIPGPVLFQKSAGFKGIRLDVSTHHCRPTTALQDDWKKTGDWAKVPQVFISFAGAWLLSESDLKRSPTFHPIMFYWQCFQALWAIVNSIRHLINM